MTEKQKEERWGPVVCKMTSQSDPDKKEYEVRYSSQGEHTCNCKSFIFSGRGGTPKSCKHTRYARLKEITNPIDRKTEGLMDCSPVTVHDRIVQAIKKHLWQANGDFYAAAQEIEKLFQGVPTATVETIPTGAVRIIVLDD